MMDYAQGIEHMSKHIKNNLGGVAGKSSISSVLALKEWGPEFNLQNQRLKKK